MKTRMKKKAFVTLLLAALIGLGFLFVKHIYQKHIIFLKNGTYLIADNTWILGDNVFYQQNKEVRVVEMARVRLIKHDGSIDPTSSLILTQHLWKSCQKKLAGLFEKIPLQKATLFNWILLLSAMSGAIVICLIVFFKLKQSAPAAKTKKMKSKAFPPPRAAESQTEYQGREAIVQFFLMIFKYQKGIREEGEALFRPVDTRTPDGNFIYELRVQDGKEWVSRRMTIGPIGEESGSRSTCYYVIYDDHMVVKIPPLPITKFEKYIQSIKRDAAIAEKLKPKECLIPRVSVILKKVLSLDDDTDLSMENQEDRYIEWAKNHENFQSFLMIGNTFVYFMDLSKYFFLGHILKDMHSITHKIREEAVKRPGILWDPVEFESRYGLQHMRILDDLRPIYTSFENRTKDVLLQHRMVDEISPFQLKEWFLICLAGDKLTEKNTEVKHVIASQIQGAVLSLFQHQFKAVDQYRKMVRHYVATKNFQQQKAQLSGLITNLMDLLVWLNQKKIAMRDLKPDNLLVAGNPSKFPQFLESPALYSIGLIDVETAVSYDAQDFIEIQQPPLGGTPAYSTPSHMLRNDTLVRIFGDLPQVLHLQDWHATVGMVYLVATGERLFVETAKTLLQLKASIKDKAKKKSKPLETIAQASQTFWHHAMAEFDQKLKDHHKQLHAIKIIISKTARPILLDTISDTKKRVTETIRQLTASQQIFKGEKTQENLAAASHVSISHFQLKFLDEHAEQLSEKNKTAASRLLNELIYLKKQSAHLKFAAGALQKSVPTIRAGELLNAMFTIVLVMMHQRLWGTLLQDINFHGQ